MTNNSIAADQSKFWLGYMRVIQFMAAAGAALFVFATILVLTEICSRYFFRRPIMGTVEITEYCLVWITFLAAPWVQARGGNVKVEFLVAMLNPRTQSVVCAATAMLATLACAILTYAGFRTVWSHFQIGYDLPTPLHPPSAPIICIIPISTLLLTIQFARETKGFWRDAIVR
jgi:TRAP-type C4-dicarboxylate transport system permease small subunit